MAPEPIEPAPIPPPRPGVAALVLAAGAASRFGSPKQLARVGEGTMLEAVLAVARAAGLDPILAVVPPGMAVPPDVVPVINDRQAAGLSRSLRLGIGALPPETSAAVILLGDQPTLDPEVVRAIVAARGDRPMVATQADGVYGPPVVVERSAFTLIEGLRGDIGLREVLSGRGDMVRAVPVSSHAPDIDTVEDLADLRPG